MATVLDIDYHNKSNEAGLACNDFFGSDTQLRSLQSGGC